MNDLKYMYKKVSCYALYILITLSVILGLINFKFILPGILGLTVGIGNLFISGIVTNNALVNNKVNSLTYFGYVFKVFTTSVIGLILFTYNKDYLIVYMGGYISHFIPIALYTVSLKDEWKGVKDTINEDKIAGMCSF